MNEPLVEIQKISKKFPGSLTAALEGIDATIPQGQIVGLVGPDAAGKTTLIRLIAGLLLPTEGSIQVAGFDTRSQAEEIHAITGYMPQKFGLYEDLTVLQNLHLYADLRGLEKALRKETFEKLLRFTALGPFTNRLAGNLSGGMKQKLGLACALIKKPQLLLLDEPSVGVDPVSRRELWQMVHQLIDEGVSVLWSTAYLDEAERCHSVLLLNEGKLLYSGPPDQLTKRVEGRVVRLSQIQGSRRKVLSEALSEEGVIDGVIQGSEVRLVLKDTSTPINIQAIGAGTIRKVPPRFEDAFVDILGGGPGGESLLAKQLPQLAEKKQAIIEAKGLTKKFGAFTAADHIDFSVQSGEIFGLLGPNGAGKSTTFKMLCGLLTPTSGESYINGINLQTASVKARQQIGYMAQKFSLYGTLNVSQNLDFFSGIYGLSGSKRKQKVDQMIETFALKPFLDTNADQLPLGFKQRLALSCAVMHSPSVLFLDEPTSGVDPITRREFWNHINGLVEKGVTVMVTTHFMDEAEYCDHIALVYRGVIIHRGEPDALKNLVKSPTLPEPTLEDAFIELIQDYDKEHP